MIVSHSHRFIFLKTNKTAGTSAEIALSRFCQNGDILTPLTPRDEALRHELTSRKAANFLAPVTDYRWPDVVRAVRSRRRKRRFYHHMPARELKPYLSEQAWDGYYKFCIERNPWDRVISFYYWQHPAEPRPSLDDFLNSPRCRLLKERGFNVYTIDGALAVDRVLRFERLADDLEEVRVHLGLPQPLVLPLAKSSSRKDRRHYREILTDAQRQRIAEMFADEIDMFEYEF
jgi:hypothetical protein